MIAPLNRNYRTGPRHILPVQHRGGTGKSRRLDAGDRLEWNLDTIGGRLFHTHWSEQPATRVNHAERRNKVHHARGGRSGNRLHLGLLYDRLIVLGYTVLHKLGLVDPVRVGTYADGERVYRVAVDRRKPLRLQDRQQGLVLRSRKPDHRRDRHTDTYAEPDCGA